MTPSRILQAALARGVVCAAALFTLTAGAATGGSHYAVTGQIDGPEGAWTFASLDPVKHRLYVGRTDGILVVDLRANVSKALPLGGQRVQMVVPVPGSDVVVGTKDKSNSAVLLDGSNGAVRGEIATGRAPETAAFDPASALVAVMAGSGGEVTLIDPVKGVAVGSIAVQGILESGAADGKGRLYINLEDQGRIAVVDIAGRKLVSTYALPGCEGPTGLGFDAQSNLLLSACGNHVAKAIDAATGADRGTIDIGSSPDAVMVDSQRRVAFIPTSEGHLAVISPGSWNPSRPRGARRPARWTLPRDGSIFPWAAPRPPTLGVVRYPGSRCWWLSGAINEARPHSTRGGDHGSLGGRAGIEDVADLMRDLEQALAVLDRGASGRVEK